MSRHLIFVYGTLKTGQPNHYVMNDKTLGNANLVGKAETVDEFPLVITSKYNIPFLLHKKGTGNRIIGEVYSVDDQLLAKMDEFESHPSYYTRLETDVTMSDGSVCRPWCYFILNFKPELLSLTTYAEYSSYGDHGLPYVERSERNHSIDGTPEKYDVLTDIKLFL